MENSKELSQSIQTLCTNMPNAMNIAFALLPECARDLLLKVLLQLPMDRRALFRRRLKDMTLDRAKIFGKTFARDLMESAKNYFFTSMLPTNESQHYFNRSSEGTAITLKDTHLQNPRDRYKYLTDLHYERRAMEIEHKHRQNQLNCLRYITNLPYELRAMVMDKYFETILLPGEVEPTPCNAHPGSNCFLYNESSFWCQTALRTTSSKMYNRYQQRYWSENTVASRSSAFSRATYTYLLQQIVRSRRLAATVELLRTLPDEFIDSIRSVRLVLGRYDIRCNICMAFDYDNRHDALLNYMRHYNNCQLHRRHLMSRWRDAASYVLTLKAQHLVFDVSDAYSMDGKWLGSSLVEQLDRPRPDLPREYEVIAPNPHLEELILGAIHIFL